MLSVHIRNPAVASVSVTRMPSRLIRSSTLCPLRTHENQWTRKIVVSEFHVNFSSLAVVSFAPAAQGGILLPDDCEGRSDETVMLGRGAETAPLLSVSLRPVSLRPLLLRWDIARFGPELSRVMVSIVGLSGSLDSATMSHVMRISSSFASCSTLLIPGAPLLSSGSGAARTLLGVWIVMATSLQPTFCRRSAPR